MTAIPPVEVCVEVKVVSAETVRAEAVKELRATIDEVLHDISWRATRYASNGDFAAHNLMVEAHRAAWEYLNPDQPYGDCDCVQSFTGGAK